MPAKREAKKKKPPITFDTCIVGITSTQPGQERNMYPFIRDLFVHILAFKPEDVFTDTAAEGGIPDVAVMAPTGVLDARGKEIKSRWLVLEAKDEAEIFLNDRTRRATFAEKSKYIELDTVWFAMVDPSCLVLRPVSTRSANYDSSQDIVIQWNGLTELQFKERCILIEAENAGVNRRLQAFRDGEERHIAEVKLSAFARLLNHDQEALLERSRNEFYLAMRTSAQLLQYACRRALDTMMPETEAIRKLLKDFDAAYQIREFNIDPFRLAGTNLNSREAFRKHMQDVRQIRELLKKNPPVARFAWFTYPEFLQRAKNEQDTALDLLAAETASLILARSMMLRFFEDHGFFKDKKYLCNGGVKAFQEMRRYYGTSYARLLRESYGEGSKIYSAIFSDNDLDWVLSNTDKQLSIAIERVLFYLSHFDFATIDQDVLSNVYGQFLDTSQRKRLGEHYTPPDIARYIVRQLDLKKGDKVIDPTCGLGTFLIEAYKVLAGNAAAKGVGSYDDVLEALKNVRGNDLNTFSAMVAQIQLLWHLFIFRDDILKRGFPETTITGGYNSLRLQGTMEGLFDAHATEFSLIDQPEYAAVVGNPPYVRPERQEAELSKEDQGYFSADISPKVDLYSLFLYKAMDGWCRSGNADLPPGKTGFVLPLSFCDNDDNRPLRRLFEIGGKWRIIEIVDLELIGPFVFSADVVPIILIAEKRPATEQDRVRLRVADERCAKFTGLDQKHIQFDLNQSISVEMPYADIFTPDGRILTKINPGRKAVLDRFCGQTFDDIAQRFWVGKSKNTIIKWSLEKPIEVDELRWEEADMLRRGAVFRREIHQAAQDGITVFKGENIVSCRIEGNAQHENIDATRVADPSLWRFADILPEGGFVLHQIATALTCAPFDPHKAMFLDTATLFIPDRKFAEFPFDILVLSRLYQYVFALREREAVLFRARCHIYPSTVRRLPWSEKLAEQQPGLIQLRQQFLKACENLHRRSEVLLEKLDQSPHTTLKQAVAESDVASVEWSEELGAGKSIRITEPILMEREGWFVVQPSDDLLHWIVIKDKAIAECFIEGLLLQKGESFSRSAFLEMPMPRATALKQWRRTVAEFDKTDYEESLTGILDKLDRIVAKAFKVPPDEVEFIKAEFEMDPMLRRVRPNLPFTDRRLVGLRKGLAGSDRYDKAYKTRG
jgi:hypothetical protein